MPEVTIGPTHKLSEPERRARRVKNRLRARKRSQGLSGAETWVSVAKDKRKRARNG